MCGGESNLFHFSKVVCGVAVQHELTHWDQRVFCMWPDLGGGTGRVRQGAEKGVRKGGRKEGKVGVRERERRGMKEGELVER